MHSEGIIAKIFLCDNSGSITRVEFYVLGDRILINVFGFVSICSLNTPPGTKIKLSGIVEVRNGFLLLDDGNTTVLGGEVEHLIEKWELQRVR